MAWPSPRRRGFGPAGGSGLGTTEKGPRRGNPAGVLHENVWGLVGIPLEFPRMPSHIGTAARKTRQAGETARFRRRPLGDRQFRALQSVTKRFLTCGCVRAPRASFCVL